TDAASPTDSVSTRFSAVPSMVPPLPGPADLVPGALSAPARSLAGRRVSVNPLGASERNSVFRSFSEQDSAAGSQLRIEKAPGAQYRTTISIHVSRTARHHRRRFVRAIRSPVEPTELLAYARPEGLLGPAMPASTQRTSQEIQPRDERQVSRVA